MFELNLWFGWLWVTAGLVAGAVIGLRFYDVDWLDGYASWRRRMVRLGHIALVGTGLLNVAAALTVAARPENLPSPWVGWSFIVGAVAMPAVCFLSAWRDEFRRLFFIPVACLIVAAAAMAIEVCR